MSTKTAGDNTPSTDSELGQSAKTSILKASAIMASGTMVSRILGLVRSMMLLAAIGAAGGGVSAAFQTANTLPNTVFNLLASGVFDAVLVPQIVGALKKRHDGETYVNRLLTLGGTLLFLVTIISMIAAPLLVIITAAGYDAQIRRLAILFALLCLPQLFFYGLYNLLGELLNARGVFGPYMWAPVVNNVVGIAGLGAFLFLWGQTDSRLEVADFTSVQFWVLGGSATLGVIAQALVLLIPMKRAGIHFTPDFHFRGTSFGSTSKVAAWTFATLGVSQIGVLSTNNLAALADAYAKAHEGFYAGINAYATAFMIFMVPQSLITVSLTTAIFTRMAESVSDRDDRGVAATYDLGVRTITSLTLLAAAILMAGAVPMMQMALPTYSNQEIVSAYAWILSALMPGVASTGMVLMSQRVFFAYEDVKPVFLMGIAPTILQVIVGWSMYALTGAKWWVVGAALAETCCRLVQGIIAVWWVAARNEHVERSSLLRSYARFLISAVCAGLVSFGALHLVGVHTHVDSTVARFGLATIRLVFVSVLASVVYMIVVRFLSPADSSRTIAPLLSRLRVPRPLRAILAAPSHMPVASTPQEAIMGEDIVTQTKEAMMREDEPEGWTPPPFGPAEVTLPSDASHKEKQTSDGDQGVEDASPEATQELTGDELNSPQTPAGGSVRPQTVGGAPGRRLIDPTVPTLIFAAALTLVAGIWGVSTALAPVSDLNIARPIVHAESDQSGGDEGPQSEPSPPAEQVAPTISSASVLSWSDDDGDHPDTAVNMIDGNPKTSWHSRWYDYNQFLDESNVTIVIKLQNQATISSLTVAMDPSTSGGELVVRNVTDPANPRGGTELVTTALSPTTEITLPQAVSTGSIALSFRSMPTSVDGNNWAWISEITVK